MPDAAIMKIMINYGIYGVAVCAAAARVQLILVVEGKGLKFPWICLWLILRQMCLPLYRSAFSVYTGRRREKLAQILLQFMKRTHNCRAKGFRIPI